MVLASYRLTCRTCALPVFTAASHSHFQTYVFRSLARFIGACFGNCKLWALTINGDHQHRLLLLFVAFVKRHLTRNYFKSVHIAHSTQTTSTKCAFVDAVKRSNVRSFWRSIRQASIWPQLLRLSFCHYCAACLRWLLRSLFGHTLALLYDFN